MTNEEITQTIQHEIQQAQQPLLERIADLEQELDLALDYISSLNALSGVAMMNVPLLANSIAAQTLRESFDQLPLQQQSEKPAQLLLYWAVRFERQAEAFDQDTQELDAINAVQDSQRE